MQFRTVLLFLLNITTDCMKVKISVASTCLLLISYRGVSCQELKSFSYPCLTFCSHSWYSFYWRFLIFDFINLLSSIYHNCVCLINSNFLDLLLVSSDVSTYFVNISVQCCSWEFISTIFLKSEYSRRSYFLHYQRRELKWF